MRLTKGVTGFDFEHDERTFKSMVYHFASCEKTITVRGFENNSMNVYMKAFIEIDGDIFTVLHHRYMPYIAFSLNNNSHNTSYYFVTKQEWRKYFPYRKCLTATELNTSIFENRDLHSLSQTEWKYIRYYNSETIGEVMFNFWD